MNTEYETMKHIAEVRKGLDNIVIELLIRSEHHDNSKLSKQELPIFKKYTPLLKKTTYGSPRYKKYLKEMRVALDHHYKHNLHHPEHFKKGITNMSLLDIVEMLCDWKAATKRHADGNIVKSIEINQKRFGYSDELKQVFLNTVGYLL